MPFTPVPRITYPDVPRGSSGVPDVLFAVNVAVTVAALVTDALIWAGFGDLPQWGFFDQSGFPLVDADTVTATDLRREESISSYPVEVGSFANYNKVERPFEGKVTYAKAISVDDRGSMLGAVDEALKSLDPYILVMPEFSYESLNITHYDVRRSSRSGAGMMIIDVWAEEVRIVEPTQFSNTATSDGADPQDQGNQAPAEPTPPQNRAVSQKPPASAGNLSRPVITPGTV